MLDKSIPYKNIFMKAERLEAGISANLPDGYRFQFFEEGDESSWAAIVTSVGEFDTADEARKYLVDYYSAQKDEFKKRCLFVLDEEGRFAGTCTAWHENKEGDTVSAIHWFAVKPEFQGKGLGKALLNETLKLFYFSDSYPVYLHTQTWSYKAIHLYSRAGFRILKEESFSDIENNYEEAMPILKTVLNESSYNALLDSAL